MSKRSTRIIRKLRKLYPTERWLWDNKRGCWVGSTFNVGAVSCSPDEETGTHVIRYQRTDTFAYVEELGSRVERYTP